MRKRMTWIVAILVLSALLMACSNDQHAADNEEVQKDTETKEDVHSEVEDDYFYKELVHIHNELYEQSSRNDDIDVRKELHTMLEDKQTINIVLEGTHRSSSEEEGFTDMMALLSINPHKNSIKVVNVPRATRVAIPNKSNDKIKHAHSFGGPDLSMQTVEENFNVPVHFYVHIQMSFFSKAMDRIEHISIDNQVAFSQGNFEFPEGIIELDELDLLGYLRGSEQDSHLEMDKRQTEVVYAIVQEMASLSETTQIDDIVHLLRDDIRTTIDQDALHAMYVDYFDTGKSIDVMELTGDFEDIDGISYYVVPAEEFDRIGTEINEYMK